MALLQFIPAGPSSTTLTLVNGAVSTGYVLLAEGTDWGNAAWDAAFSGPRGTLGAKVATQTPQNRQVNLAFRVSAATKDAVAAALSVLAESVDDLRRYGGRIKWRSNNATYAVYFDVMTAAFGASSIASNSFETNNRAVVSVQAVCAPYAEGDPMDTTDGFTVDTVNGTGAGGSSDYTADAGALGNVSVAGGVLQASANLGTQNRLIHTGRGYTYGDHQVTLKAVPGTTITSFLAGAVLKRAGASNYLAVYVDDNGTNSRLRIDKVVGGSTTNLASTNLGSRIATGTPYWVRGRIEGNKVFAEHFTAQPHQAATPTTSTSYVLTAAEAVLFGENVEGRAGVVYTPQSANSYLDDLEILPWVYARRSWPLTRAMAGRVPGDAPAKGRILIAQSGSDVLKWVAGSWSPKPTVFNLVHGGHFESSSLWNWGAGAVTGVTGAATSITKDTTTAKYGSGQGKIVCPATANTGATFPIWFDFKAGTPYVALLWAKAASGTTNTRVRLGQNGDIASESATALSASWNLRTVTWTPTADRKLAYLCMEITAATATTFQIDGAMVFEGLPMDITASISSTTATSCTVRSVPAGWPAAPFLALIDSELVTVSSISGTTLTISRGAEGSTAATHSSGAYVYPLPTFRSHVEGWGGFPAFGHVDAANGFYSGGDVSQTTDANARSGTYLQNNTQPAGPMLPLDVGLVDPLDGASALPVEVFARYLASYDSGTIYWNTADQPAFWFLSSPALATSGTPDVKLRMSETGAPALVRPQATANSKYRNSRVGTFVLPAAGTSMHAHLSAFLNRTVSSASFGTDFLLMLRGDARFATVTGRALTEGVGLLPGDGATITIDSDLTTAVTRAVSSNALVRTRGPGGSPVELQPGLNTVCAHGSVLMPNYTDTDGASDTTTNTWTVAVSATPRWAVIRGS